MRRSKQRLGIFYHNSSRVTLVVYYNKNNINVKVKVKWEKEIITQQLQFSCSLNVEIKKEWL